jgi:arylsulfatase A-like enzyme
VAQPSISRRDFLRTVGLASAACTLAPQQAKAETTQPNFVFILADDQGYGDVGYQGSTIPTPTIDAIAKDGITFSDFYGCPVCSPSRAALMTGQYPTRVGVPSVFSLASTNGLSLSAPTIPEVLKSAGYHSMLVGKWHLGSTPGRRPTERGFDQFYGLYVSNDQGGALMRGTSVVEVEPNNDMSTQKFTAEAIAYITECAKTGRPFFLCVAHVAPHLPIGVSSEFKGKSDGGTYGDAVMELDWSVGQIRQALIDQGVADNTLLIFTSDNGPWFQGSSGNLRGRKGETSEGGMRVPFAAVWPSRIPAGRKIDTYASMMDIMPTYAALAGVDTSSLTFDGINIAPLLDGTADSLDRDVLLFFYNNSLQCARWGQWKLHFARDSVPPWINGTHSINLPLNPHELYDLSKDPGETRDCLDQHPEIADYIFKRALELLLTFPANVQQDFRDTLARPVQGNTAGARPTPAEPVP